MLLIHYTFIRLLNTLFYLQEWDTDDEAEDPPAKQSTTDCIQIDWASVLLSEPLTATQMDVDYDVDYDAILQHL